MKSPFLILLSAAMLLGSAADLHAQGYPKVKSADQAAANARQAAANQRSDEIFARVLPEIEAWAAKGKPYLPGAGLPGDLPQAKIPAFPGAEGGGMYSFGGRGGRVIVVTNLNDDGPGSFRAACEAAGPRIVIFNVAGIIRLTDRIRVRAPYITIAGNTAPGDGVCIAGNTVELETHDIVIRHMRFRRGAMDAADRNECYRWALNNRPPVRNWSTARATLMGDAAHPTLPFMAQGAAMAVEDGAVLARALDGAASIPDALQVYQRARMDRTARVVNESTEHGGLYHIVDPEEMRRAFEKKNLAKERAEWLFSYDPLTVPLS